MGANDGGVTMRNFDNVFCCNKKQLARVYDITAEHCFRKTLFFLDECSQCGNTVAIVKEFDKNMNVKRVIRRSGDAAIRLYIKYSTKFCDRFKTTNDLKNNMDWKYQKNGKIYDFNNNCIENYGKSIQ